MNAAERSALVIDRLRVHYADRIIQTADRLQLPDDLVLHKHAPDWARVDLRAAGVRVPRDTHIGLLDTVLHHLGA